MEQNVQVIAKKVWHIMRVAYFMLRKNISKRKFLLDLKYLTMKRSKLAGKSFAAAKLTHRHHPTGGAYEFSCSNTPNHQNFFSAFHVSKNNGKKQQRGNESSHAPIYEEEASEIDAVKRVLEMMVQRNDDVEASPCPYPDLPGFGFGRSPAVRQLRVTDSPYPYPVECEEGEMGNNHVDEAAEEFIQRFYSQLKQQRITGA